MIKIYYNKNLFVEKQTESTERVFCIPFQNKELFIEDKFENNRFGKVIEEGNKYLIYTSIEQCDYVILPFKFNARNNIVEQEIVQAKLKNKKIILIFNDDRNIDIPISESEGIIFKTSINKSTKKNNEFSFPAFCGDFFEGFYNEDIKTIGFCGAITHLNRAKILNKLYKIDDFEKDFIIRQNFLATEIPKEIARSEYIRNMSSNVFNVCTRGAGNFSYRFYETFMMGRIPIFINTDCVLPFENIINYNESLVFVEEKDINIIDEILKKWLLNKTQEDIINIQKNNREIWVNYFSPLGWIKNFTKEFKTI